MELGLVRRIDIDTEMQQAYLDYAMSVIVARALPDARDGLKPVHRRILYAMYDMGIRSDSPYKKSARIVGEVLGKYHPHGDMAVYEAMARMAQDFSMRCLLVDGQGNFGSVDGDPPAAMRYTEARLAAPALHMLADIHKNTVDFDANFDDTLSEPSVLPSAVPNLLVNGATGIAVGMSTSIPPHNLGEVVDALKHLLQNWERMDDIGLEDLMHFIQGPDFPTGGVIILNGGEDSLGAAYGSGRGRVTVQARAHLEEMERGRNRIIVTELPYMTNKSTLIERIAELARDGRLEGLADLRDESDRQGMRIVIELVKTADPETVLRDLYKHTPMQSTFSLIMLALVDGEPRLLTLKQALRVYLDHRLEVIRRRSQYDLEKARQRAHILEGLRVALKNLDEVIDLIRKAADADAARTRLMKRFKLSDLQSQAILDMQLRRLAALERKKIEDEYKEVQALIKVLEGLLHSPKKMRQVAGEELQAVKDAYGDRRRTQIVHFKEGEEKRSMLTIEDLAPEKTAWLVVTPDGLVSRTLEDKMPRQSGSEAPAWMLRVNTRDTLYLASELGETAAVPLLSIPETDVPTQGLPYAKISALEERDKLAALFTLPPKGERPEGSFVLSLTCQGMVKKSPVSDLPGPSAHTFTLVKVNEGDRLGWLRLTDGKAEVLLATAQGMAIRFSEDEVRSMGLVAAGVMAVKLGKGDEVAGMDILPQAGEVFMIASDGSAKRVAAAQFPRQGRHGQGVVAWKLPPKVRISGMAIGRGTARVTLHLSKMAPRMMRLDEAPLQTRVARGGKIQSLKGVEQVLALTMPWDLGRSPMEMQEDEIKKPRRARAERDGRAAEQVTFEQVIAQTSETPQIRQRKPKTAVAAAKNVKPAKRKRPSTKASPIQMTLQPVVMPAVEKASPAAPKRAAVKSKRSVNVSARAKKKVPAKLASTRTAAVKTKAKATPAKVSVKPASPKAPTVKTSGKNTTVKTKAKSTPAKVSAKRTSSKAATVKTPGRTSTTKTKATPAKAATIQVVTKKSTAKIASAKALAKKPAAKRTPTKPGTAKTVAKKTPAKAGLAKPSPRKTPAKSAVKKTVAKPSPAKTRTKQTPGRPGAAKAIPASQKAKKNK